MMEKFKGLRFKIQFNKSPTVFGRGILLDCDNACTLISFSDNRETIIPWANIIGMEPEGGN